MADFNSLLRTTAFEAPKPRNFPEGTYKGNVKGTKLGERAMLERMKIVITFDLKATEWPDDVAGTEQIEGLQLAGKTFQKDFIIDKENLEKGVKDDLWPLDQFLKSLGVSGGTTYEELLPHAIGAEVQFQLGLRSYKSKTTGEMEETNDVKRVTGLAA